MNLAKLKDHVKRAVQMLYDRDSDLLTQDASEWAIAHRLAVYLEYELPEWNVDCEYNRQGPGKNPKEMPNEDKVRPDIILHRRGKLKAEHNLLVVEVKKHNADSDRGKACAYTMPPNGAREFQYQFGLALSVINGPTMHWFTNGSGVS